jgi:hypothetical protein
MKPIEEHLAEYALGLYRGEWWRGYVEGCLAVWREAYGERVAERAKALINAGMRGKKEAK